VNEPQPWPTGVIARYLTVGGAHVDLTHQFTVNTPPEAYATLATCTGCPDTEQFRHWFGYGSEADGTYTEAPDQKRADNQARRWAQDHAETCRAMPRPEATR
jgi:hypothetical protein